MEHEFALNFHDRHPRVSAKIAISERLEYTTNGNEVTVGISDRPQIVESMIGRKDLSIDVMEGYDPATAATINHHSIYHMYEFEDRTRFLDRLTSTRSRFCNEMQTKFLLCRYVICLIDDAMRQNKHFELMAIRLNGDIYIGANKQSEFMNDNSKMNAYGGLNFPKMVTKSNTTASSKQHHSVVRKMVLECRDTLSTMTLFVSSVARAFDSTGNVVEVKTCGINVLGKLQNLPAVKARNWWLRALLSGSDRIVYGLRRNDRKIHEIQEARLSDFTHGHFHFSETELFSFIFSLFKKIDYMITANGEMCLIRSMGFDRVFIQKTTSESLKRSPFW